MTYAPCVNELILGLKSKEEYFTKDQLASGGTWGFQGSPASIKLKASLALYINFSLLINPKDRPDLNQQLQCSVCALKAFYLCLLKISCKKLWKTK